MINSKMIFRILGFLLLIETAMLLCCGGVSLFYEEGDLKSFLISSALSAGIGVVLLAIGKGAENHSTDVTDMSLSVWRGLHFPFSGCYLII